MSNQLHYNIRNAFIKYNETLIKCIASDTTKYIRCNVTFLKHQEINRLLQSDFELQQYAAKRLR